MSVYRITNQGWWTEMTEPQKNRFHIDFFIFHKKKTFSKKYSKVFDKLIISQCNNLFMNTTNNLEKIKLTKYFFILWAHQIKFLLSRHF